MRHIKAAIGWAALIALGVFIATNLHKTTVELPGISLTAPVAYIIALAAVLGALGSSGFRTMLKWARPTAAAAREPDPVAREAPAASIAPAALGTPAEPRGYGATDTGRKRDHNEDFMIVDDELGLYVVSDGMGGHAGGEVAAALASEHVHDYIAARRDELGAATDTDTDTVAVTVAKQAVVSACAAVHAHASSDPKLAGMGCTMTLLLVSGERGIMAHVGDTRLYRWRDGQVEQLSADHTVVAELQANGALTPEEARNSAFGHTITRCLGHAPSVNVDTLAFDLRPDDRYVLCSDGLTEYAPNASDLVGLFDESTTALPGRAVAFANEQGGQDNVTVVAVHISPAASGAGAHRVSGRRRFVTESPLP